MLYLALYLLSFPQWQAPALALPPALAGLQLGPVALPAALPAAALMAAVSLPGFAVKQVVNVVQLRTAAQQLVALDAQKRGRQ